MFSRLVLLTFLIGLSLPTAGAGAAELGDVVGRIVDRHMTEKRIPGLSVAIVQRGQVVFAGAYGRASVELGVPASPDTVYPISSVSRMFAGLVAVRLLDAGKLDLDASISTYIDAVPEDKRRVTVRHLLQHTHGLEDFYRSEAYASETGKSLDDATGDELIGWSLGRPLRHAPGDEWSYGVIGYVVLAKVLEQAGGLPFERLVDEQVFAPTGMAGAFGGSETIVAGRNPLLYELVDARLVGHIVDFPPMVWAAGGLNTSVSEMAKLFVALSADEFISTEAKRELWTSAVLPDGASAHYALGWSSYTTSRDRWVVGHEGGGASWVIYYPALDLAVIALSNMSGARADSLPFDIARAAIDAGLL